MARYIGPTCRLCRREGEKLFLKGTKCNTDKCPLIKRNYSPGQHGQKKTKLSNYSIQLREKQKVKRMYGILERQFRHYFKIASRSRGITGKVLLQLLERRLDNVIFRLGVALSRAQARQMVRHNFVYVNSRKVNIPSYLVKKDDIIELKSKDNIKRLIEMNLELSKERESPVWLEWNRDTFTAKVLRLPEREDIGQPIEEHLIVELYSK
ncbi:MAG: 30S ribosomal protein S4 [Candidatus Omnitrophica bacterium]|nr:30S ribosomal protein S4 [Candidatus Omnitrophota bacterium]